MAENLSFDLFALAPVAQTNDFHRPGTLLFEYHEETITIATNEGTVEVDTDLDEVLGLVDFSYVSGGAADASDTIKLVTDGAISTGAVTVNALSADVANGDIIVRMFLIGKKSNSSTLSLGGYDS